jgi:hypothetical protein
MGHAIRPGGASAICPSFIVCRGFTAFRRSEECLGFFPFFDTLFPPGVPPPVRLREISGIWALLRTWHAPCLSSSLRVLLAVDARRLHLGAQSAAVAWSRMDWRIAPIGLRPFGSRLIAAP